MAEKCDVVLTPRSSASGLVTAVDNTVLVSSSHPLLAPCPLSVFPITFPPRSQTTHKLDYVLLVSTFRVYRRKSRFLLGNSRSMVDRPIEGREIEGEPADESNSGPHCCSPPFRAVLGHFTVVSPLHERPGYGGPAGAPVLCLSGGVPNRAAAEAFVPRWGGKENCFPIRFVPESGLGSSSQDPFSTTPYSLTHRLFPFRDYGCCFRVPWCRSHRSRGTCATDALRRDAIRRTSFVLVTERGEPFWKLFIGRGGKSSYQVI